MKNIMLFTKQEKSWILYDVADSAFVLIVITTVMPVFFKDIASRGTADAVSTANWGFANSAASLVLAVLAPVMGTFADYKGMKKRFFAGFLFVGIVFTLLLTFIGPGQWLQCLLIFILARIGFSGSNIFYDAFLPDVTEKEGMNRISSSGYAWGYIGSVIPFLTVMALICFSRSPEQHAALPILSAKAAFVIAALWWLAFSLPMLKNVQQRHYIMPGEHPVRDSFARLAKTFKDIREYRNVFLFLIAYFFYIDGVDTIITMATAYGRDIGLSLGTLLSAILTVQIAAFPFALLYGKLADRFSEKKLLYAGIGVYILITFTAFFLPVLPSDPMKELMFWILSFLIASSMGGIQALSRSFFGKLIPPERSAEFFGFYNIFGKFAAITGPFLMGMTGRIAGDSRYGVLSLLILFIVGGTVLYKVEKNR